MFLLKQKKIYNIKSKRCLELLNVEIISLDVTLTSKWIFKYLKKVFF